MRLLRIFKNNNKKIRSKYVLVVIFLFLSLNFAFKMADTSTVSSIEGEGFLIVTREMFVDSLDEYIEWKTSRGFEVYVVTAEWITNNVDGEDLIIKIRNCIRNYYSTKGVKYILLIGDSINMEFEKNLFYSETGEWQEPPEPSLSEPWNLPAGYYRWDSWFNYPRFTSLFYSDLSDKVHYGEDEYYYLGNFSIYVGLIPVRTTNELQTILSKTMLTPYFTYPNVTLSQSNLGKGDVASSSEDIPLIREIAGSSITIDAYYHDSEASTEFVDETIFDRKGVVWTSGHGSINSFIISNYYVEKEEAYKFQYINPLYIGSSCFIYEFYSQGAGADSDCLDEAFLKAQKGPAVIITSSPEGPNVEGVPLTEQETGFWEDLLGGKSIGQAFYDNCYGASQNPLHLFGDPSLVVIGEPEPPPSEEPPFLLIAVGAAFATAAAGLAVYLLKKK